MKTREFIAIATADKKGKPNSAPKLLLKTGEGIAYFVDYNIGRTARNLKVNPEVSLSFIDTNSLIGYRLNGKAEIIEKGDVYDECLKELMEKKIKLSVERVIRGLQDGKVHKEFELEIPDRMLVYKVKMQEGCELTPRGEIKRENIRE